MLDTSKEEALTIYKDFLFIVNDPIIAKKCSILSVDKLIVQQNQYNNGTFYKSNYFDRVKNELEKL